MLLLEACLVYKNSKGKLRGHPGIDQTEPVNWQDAPFVLRPIP